MSLTKRFSNYVQENSVVITSALMFLSGNVNVSVIEDLRRHN